METCAEGDDTVTAYPVRHAEIRVFDQAPGTNDASDMYVLDLSSELGVTVRVRQVRDQDSGSTTHVVVEADSDAFWPVSVFFNETETVYGEES